MLSRVCSVSSPANALVGHTFATMMIASGTDVRTVASYLGHANVAMTLNNYAEVDPDAKRAAVGKIGEAFDADLDGVLASELEAPALTMSFTVEQLEAMLAEARKREGAGENPHFKVS